MSDNQSQSIEGKMDTIFKKTLPDSLTQLSKRNESFSQVVSHLESEYVRTGADKDFVENEAKTFVAQGLVNILQDIEIAAININQLVDLQAVALDSLNTQVDVIQGKLTSMKSQHLLSGLEEMKHTSVSKTAKSEESSSNEAASMKETAYKRVSMEERLSRLSSVGVGSAVKQ